MAGTGRAEQDSPVAGIGRIGIPVLLAETKERVLARQDDAVRIGDAHVDLPLFFFPAAQPRQQSGVHGT